MLLDAPVEIAEKKNADVAVRELNNEIAQWLTVWLQTPEVFEHWVVLRQNAPEFIDKFGSLGKT